jgi:cell division protein FtsB
MFNKKTKFSKIIQFQAVLIFLGFITLLFAWNLIGFVCKMLETNRNKKIAQDKVSGLVESKEKLKTEVKKLKTDHGREEVIRNKLGLAKEGEEVVIVFRKEQPIVKQEIKSESFFDIFKSWFSNFSF